MQGVGGESGSHRLEVKEAFSYGYNWPPDKKPVNSLTGPNVWPADEQLPGFRRSLDRFYERMTAISELVVRGMSLALEQDERWLSQYTHEGATISLMRLFRYFPYTRAPDEAPGVERIGSSPHTGQPFPRPPRTHADCRQTGDS